MIRSNQHPRVGNCLFGGPWWEHHHEVYSVHARLHREHVKHMHELEEQAIREENKSHHNFLSALVKLPSYSMLCKAHQGESVYLLLHFVRADYLHHFDLLHSARTPQAEEQPSVTTSPRPKPKQSPWPRRQHPLPDPWGSTGMDETSLKASQEGPSSSKRRETPNWFVSLKPGCAWRPSAVTLIPWKKPDYVTLPPTLVTGSMITPTTSLTSSGS